MKKAEWIQTSQGNIPDEDEGYWENYENATSRDLEPTTGRYAGYRWVLTTNAQDPEGYWELKN